MHPFPHQYTVAAAARPEGDVPLSVPGCARDRIGAAERIRRAGQSMVAGAAAHRRGRGLLRARVPGHRAASKFRWLDLHASTRGTLDKIEGIMRFTRFETHAKLHVPTGTDLERAKRLLEKAESSCLIANSLSSERHLSVEIVES